MTLEDDIKHLVYAEFRLQYIEEHRAEIERQSYHISFERKAKLFIETAHVSKYNHKLMKYFEDRKIVLLKMSDDELRNCIEKGELPEK